MCVGHANPVIAAAVKARMDEGTHFAAPTEGSIVVAEELRRRWGLPHWRFTNSGTESTMDAVHLARGFTGRDVIVKIEGTYHGHHDAVMVSVKPPADQMGDREQPERDPLRPRLRRRHAGARRASSRSTTPTRVERVLDELEGQVAGVILEPAMMNINIVPPGRRLPRARARAAHASTASLLIFDEVKTGAAVAAGGATELFGVTPDVVCLAKAICGGLPGGAVGMTDELGELVASGRVRQQGTFNGNPLVMAAAEATLLEVLTPDAYAHLHGAQRAPDGRLRADHRRVRPARPHGRHGLEGLRGLLRPSRSASTATTCTKIHHELTDLAWLYHMNHGIFMTPGAGRGVDAVGRPHRRAPRALPRGVRAVRARRDELALTLS